MKFEIHFEFRASLRKFQDLNFWDATGSRRKNSSAATAWGRTPMETISDLYVCHLDLQLGDV